MRKFPVLRFDTMENMVRFLELVEYLLEEFPDLEITLAAMERIRCAAMIFTPARSQMVKLCMQARTENRLSSAFLTDPQ